MTEEQQQFTADIQQLIEGAESVQKAIDNLGMVFLHHRLPTLCGGMIAASCDQKLVIDKLKEIKLRLS